MKCGGARIWWIACLMATTTTTVCAAEKLEDDEELHAKRTLEMTKDPGCNTTRGACLSRFMYVKAEGKRDTLHHLWSFDGYPTMLLVGTDKNSSLQINWDGYGNHVPDSVKFKGGHVDYSFGIVLSKLWIFNDVDDTGNMNNISPDQIQEFGLNDFNWVVSVEKNKIDESAVKFSATNYTVDPNVVNLNGSVTFRLSTYGSRTRSETLPHLLHTVNATQLDLVLDHVNLTDYKNARFAIEVMALDQDQDAEDEMGVMFTRTLDDEYTPGVFKLYQMMSPDKNHRNGSKGFLEWRPVSYTAPDRDVTHTTAVNYYKMQFPPGNNSVTEASLMNDFYGSNLTRMTLQALNISFGEQGDGFYPKTQYTTWTFIVSYGSLPGDAVSLLVILVIAIGFGLPATMIVGGIGYLGVKRLRRKKDTFLEIN